MSAVCKSVCVWKGFCVKVSVCVPHLIRCKTSFYFCRGQRDLQSWPLPTKLHTGWSGIGTCLYIHILSRPWAHTSRSWGGTYILWLLFYIVNDYCDYTFLIFIYVSSSYIYVGCVFCTSDALHFTIRNDHSEQVCYSCRLDKMTWTLRGIPV